MVLADTRRPAPAPGAAGPGTTRPPAGPVAPRPSTAADPLAWRKSGLLAAGLLTSLAGLHVTLDGLDWWFASAAFVLVVLAAAAITRTVARRRWLPSVVAGGVALVLLTLAYAPGQAFAALIPTFEVFGRFREIADEGFTSISRQAMPATATPGIIFLVVLLAVGCALAGDALVQAAPALAVFPFLVLLDIPVVFRTGVADPVWFLATAVVFLLLLRLRRRRAAPGAVLAVGASVLVGGLLLPAVLPDAVPVAPSSEGGGPRGLNPLITLGGDLRRDEATQVATYTTDAEAGVYLRLATLDDFDGVTWEPAMPTANGSRSIESISSPAGLAAEVPRQSFTVTVNTADIGGRWLPLPYPAESITGLAGDWFYEPDGLTVRSTNETASNRLYDVSFLDVQPDASQLQFDEPGGIAREQYLDLPRDMPEVIDETAASVAGDLGSSYDIAVALQEFFRDGSFEYSEDAPVQQGYDGTGVDVIAEFLDEKSGYCIHYASAMAVMARTLDIPARIAVGFQPGSLEMVEGVPTYEVTTHDFHAWPELYFEGIGWLRFEPTPSRGDVPDYSSVEAVDDPETPEIEGQTPTTEPTTAPTTAPDLPEEELAPVPGETTGAEDQTPVLLVLGGVLGGLVLLALVPALVRIAIRARRVRAMRLGRDPANAAWAEVRDTARDHGWIAPDTETARDLGDRLAAVLVEERASVDRLRGRVETVAYARPAPPQMDVADLAAVRDAIRFASPLKDRVRAILLPPSLLARLNLARPPADE